MQAASVDQNCLAAVTKEEAEEEEEEWEEGGGKLVWRNMYIFEHAYTCGSVEAALALAQDGSVASMCRISDIFLLRSPQ